ncbi:hypothetical protein [Salipiger abyssi]|uniref:hypothetical protein n=1 Tax=Salipiger abyssi TaxID=1250539 RepID=UPI0040593264
MADEVFDSDECQKAMDEQAAKTAVRDLFVEFLRAVSARDQNGRAMKVDCAFWHALSELSKLGAKRALEISLETTELALHNATLRDPQTGMPRQEWDTAHGAMDDLITASAKVIAERISKVEVQRRRAEGNVWDEFRRVKDAQARGQF